MPAGIPSGDPLRCARAASCERARLLVGEAQPRLREQRADLAHPGVRMDAAIDRGDLEERGDRQRIVRVQAELRHGGLVRVFDHDSPPGCVTGTISDESSHWSLTRRIRAPKVFGSERWNVRARPGVRPAPWFLI